MDDVTGSPNTIFLHNGFRSGSTWFWSRFRAAADTCAYYEPFNEALGNIKAADVGTRNVMSPSAGHPALAAPYYAEYVPLLRPEGGVWGFTPDLPYNNYYDDVAKPQQLAYIESLVAHARQRGKVPVLGFCRSCCRVPWLRDFTNGRHIMAFRNPRDRWFSYRRQVEKFNNPYFEYMAYLIAAIGFYSGVYAGFFDDLPFLELTGIPVANRGPALVAFFETLSIHQRCRIFLRVFAIDMLVALPRADLVINLDRLTAESEYRQDRTARLRTITGLADLSFEDCALPRSIRNDPDWTLCARQECGFIDRYFAERDPIPGWPLINLVKELIGSDAVAKPVGAFGVCGIE
jgi:hypothetical protein